MPSTLASDRDRFVAFAFAAADLLVETDAEGRIRFTLGALDRFGRSLRCDAAGWQGRFVFELFGKADRELIALLLEEVRGGGRRGPVVVASAEGGMVAECALIRTSATAPVHVTLRRLSAGRPAVAGRGDPSTGLLSGPAFGEFVEQEFLRLVETDRALELSLVRLSGLETLPGGLHGDRAQALVKRLSLALRAVALGGSAGRLADDRFALVHGGDGEMARLEGLMRSQLDADGCEGVRVERRDLALADATLTPSQACAALRHAIERFGADGHVEFDHLADALGQKLADTAARVSNAKAVIDSRAFFVVYQPIVRLRDQQIHHHEALTRLRDGGCAIGEFVTFAETIGFVTDFDLAVVREVFDKLAALRRRQRTARIAVNLSARSLSCDSFIDQLLALSRSAGANAGQILFEVTETFQLVDLERTNAVLQRLREAGHQICLDDFGAGSAAFHYIRALTVDYVKLDGGFVRRVLDSERDRAVLLGMVELCRSIGVTTVAEMVETHAQADRLRGIGVDLAQGYLFGRPVSDPLTPVPSR